MQYETEARVDRLETLLAQFIEQTNTAHIRSQRKLEILSREMKIFKDEMRIFKDEMKDFKDEMGAFKDRQEAETLRMNKQWGELSNKLGTFVEDLVFPSFEQIVLEKFNMEIENLMARPKRKLKDGQKKEFDLIGIAGDFVFLNSTKSTLRSQYVEDFIAEINLFWEFYPEYKEKKLIGIMASLYIDESVLSYAERNGFLVLGVGYEIMEIKNKADFEPKIWQFSA